MILQALKGYYDRVAASEPDKIPPYGYSEQYIAFAVVLASGGAVVDVNDLRIADGKRSRASLMEVPQPPKRAGKNPPPCFLWDKTGYVFGVERSEQDKAQSVENREYREAFRAYHRDTLGETDDDGLKALLAFLETWDPSQYTNLRYADDMLDTNVVFRFEGDTRLYIHQRPALRRAWERILTAPEQQRGLCLMTGQEAQIARLHPSIKGVQGGQSSGASIVSFNLDAFTSYGKEQGANAPVSDVAAFAYTTALNALLSRMRGRTEKGQPIYANRVQVADATTVFWAEADKPAPSAWADSFIAGLFDPRDDADENEVDPHRDRSEGAKVRTVLDAIAKRHPLKDAAPEIDTERTRYFVLGLSPNAARISVRFWHQGTLGELAGRFQQHWWDLQIEPVPWKSAPAIWALLYEIAAQRKGENIPPGLAGEVMRAILTGRPYPRSFFTATIMRCRADRNITGMRAAILKACLIRTEKEDVPVSLNRDNANPGYRLGRLFAVLENVQKTALPGLNATIRDRFYGAASATPGSVFPMLMRNTSHHLSNIRKGDKPRLAPWFEKEIGEIVLGLDGEFPKTLRLEDQGRFAIGYYHQRYAKTAYAPAELAQDLIAEDTNDTIEK